jgi:hypothetical protein
LHHSCQSAAGWLWLILELRGTVARMEWSLSEPAERSIDGKAKAAQSVSAVRTEYVGHACVQSETSVMVPVTVTPSAVEHTENAGRSRGYHLHLADYEQGG